MTTRKVHFSCEKMDVISVVLTHHSSWPCCLLLLPRRHGAGSTPTPHSFLVTSHQSPHRIPSSREQLEERTARDPSAHRWCLEPAQGTTGAGAAWGLSLALLCWSYSAPPRAPVGKLRRIPASARICPAKVAVHHHHRICY